MDRESTRSSRPDYRVWPFILMPAMGLAVAGFTTLLPPAPGSAHLIDPSLKFLTALLLFIALMIKPTIRLARRAN